MNKQGAYNVVLMSISPEYNAVVAEGISMKRLQSLLPNFSKNPYILQEVNVQVSQSSLDHIQLTLFVKAQRTNLVEVVRFLSHSTLTAPAPDRGEMIITGSLRELLRVVLAQERSTESSLIQEFMDRLFFAIPDSYLELAGVSEGRGA